MDRAPPWFMGIRPGRCGRHTFRRTTFPFWGSLRSGDGAFLPEEERQGSAPVVVLSHRCWQRLGSDPKLVGEFVTVNGTRCQVVGVAPEGFTGVTLVGPDLWLPLGSLPDGGTSLTPAERPDRETVGSTSSDDSSRR